MTTDPVALDKPPRTERQTQAALRNFAMFQLMGMKGNLYHLEGHITTGDYMMLSHSIERSINDLHKKLEEAKGKPKSYGIDPCGGA